MTTPLFHLSLLSRTEQNKVKALIYLLDLHALKMVERNRAISCCFYERRSDIAHIKIALRAKFYLQRLKRKPADKNWEGTNSVGGTRNMSYCLVCLYLSRVENEWVDDERGFFLVVIMPIVYYRWMYIRM